MKKRLVVVVEDGAISAIVSDNPEDFQDIDIIAVNYDCDEREDSGLARVLQPDGHTEPAFVGRCFVDRERISLAGREWSSIE